MDAWQRNYKYSRLYDDAAAPLGLIFDCEPVHFEYGGKKWLIEFWKGQYGMTTGCEIGIYTAKIPEDDQGIFSEYSFYDCAGDDDLLPMAFILRKNNRILFKRSAVHWWLTGFRLGEFSEPGELTMDIAITLKDKSMMYAFVKKLIEIGYFKSEIKILGSAVIFTLSRPRSEQPRIREKLLSRFSQWRNKLFCKEYRLITGNPGNIYEAAGILKRKSPRLYRRIFNMGKPDKLLKHQ